jgi:quinol monooxygenase YgiN
LIHVGDTGRQEDRFRNLFFGHENGLDSSINCRDGEVRKMPGKITVVARFKAKGGMEKELREMLLSLIEPSRSDGGCINYDLHQSIEDPAVFWFYENWSSKEHLSAHSATPHVQAFRAKAANLLAEPPELNLLEIISAEQPRNPA